MTATVTAMLSGSTSVQAPRRAHSSHAGRPAAGRPTQTAWATFRTALWVSNHTGTAQDGGRASTPHQPRSAVSGGRGGKGPRSRLADGRPGALDARPRGQEALRA